MNWYNNFKDTVERYRSKTALVLNKKKYTYETLDHKARQIAFLLEKHENKQIGILGARSLPVYAGVLGCLMAGKAFVALNPKFTASRNLMIIQEADLDVLIVDKRSIHLLLKNLDKFPSALQLFFPETTRLEIPKSIRDRFSVYVQNELSEKIKGVVKVEADDLAYIIFTSGSTGKPKGVPVNHGNLKSFIAYFRNGYDFTSTDRFSQTYDLSFDPFLQNTLLSWQVGAALYVIPEKALIAPGKFIKDHKLTVWDSVPSTLEFMRKFKMLKNNSFPNLRYSFFGGEALPLEAIWAWKKAAPNSIVENHYGPTETTIGITKYRIPEKKEDIKAYKNIVSIGNIFEGHDFCLLNEEGKTDQEKGELCLTGPQITSGYWKDADKNKERYVKFPKDKRLWFKTGDIVKQERENLFFIERKDFQVKVRGYRVELEEVNMTIKSLFKFDRVHSLAFPIINGRTENLFSFIETTGREPDKKRILDALRKRLPEYMVPKSIIFVGEFPITNNGKIDTKELINYIKKS